MSEFVFNDIHLDIPPEQIIVRRESINTQWQTLRTEGSTKLPSGFSRLYIQLANIRFTDTRTENSKYTGLQKLQMIVAQVRATPFVWIENEFLRSQIALDNKGQAMMFAIRSIKIRTEKEFTNVLTLDLEMDYFNYFPYMSEIVFREDIWLPKPVSEPKHSNAWKRLYLAEMKRNSYLGFSDKSRQVIELDGQLTLVANQYAQISLKDYQQLTNELTALKKLKTKLQAISEKTSADEQLPTVNDIKDIVDEVTANRLIAEIFGTTTTMTRASGVEKQEAPADALSKLEHLTTDENNSRYSLVIDPSSWSIVQLKNGKVVSSPTSIDQRVERTKPVHSSKEVLLLSRERRIKMNSGPSLRGDLIASALELDLQTRVAPIPMGGYEFPTFQCLGGTDAGLTIGISTTNNESLKALNAFYTMVEEQNRKYKLVPAGQRTIKIINDVVNMMGYKEFIVSKFEYTTTDSPGTYTAILQLESSPITSSTQEGLVQSQGFLSEHDVRLALVDIIEKNISINSKALDSSNPRVLFGKTGGLIAGGINIHTIYTETSKLYSYNGPGGEENVYFKELVNEYIKNLQKTFYNCLKHVIEKISSTNERERHQDKFISAFFTLTNKDILGIERVKEDIYKIIKDSATIKNIINAKIKTNVIAEDDDVLNGKGVAYSNKLLFAALNNLHETKKVLTKNEEIERKTRAAETIINDIRKGVVDPVAVAVEEELSDWQQFIGSFLDEIIFGGIEVPQFADVLRQFSQRRGNLSSGDCYPDFPLKQILADLEKDKAGAESLKQLKSAYDKAGLDIKNIGYTALVSPDFYLYNPQLDNGQPLVPEHLMKTAIDTIQIVQGSEHFGKVTKNWFEGQYQEDVLGSQRASELKQLQSNQDLDEEFWEANGDKIPKSTGPFAPSTLVPGNNETLLPSLAATSQAGEPVTLKEINEKRNKWNTTSKRREATPMQADKNHLAQCQVDFSLNSIGFSGENKYIPPSPGDPTKVPRFIVPVEAGWLRQNPSQDFGPREAIQTKFSGSGETSTSSTDHKGLDYSWGPGLSAGKRVFASAKGKLSRVLSENTPRGKFNGNHIVIDHGNGWTSWYLHLEDSPQFRQWLGLYNETTLPQDQKNRLLTVEAGTQIGNVGQTGRSKGPHLHFEIHQNGIPVDPTIYLDGTAIPSQGPVSYINPQNESLMTKSVEQFTKDLHSGQGNSFIRAYPTYRLYFIESDEGERKHFGFDDFFSYSSVVDIGLIRSRKMPADVMTISLTNVSGALSNRKFKNDGGLNDQGRDKDGKIIQEDERKGTTNTINENPYSSLMLQPGVQIQLRMGYSPNPEELETVFNGLITEVEFSENESIVNIVCQNFAMELAQTVQGEATSFGGWLSSGGRTANILEELMAHPDVTHFGRWERGLKPTLSADTRSVLRDDWKFVPAPQDDNIFAPAGRGIWGLFDSTPQYTMYQTNIWEVFQEMTLRHPGYIASAVPYEGKWGPRMTMFFGIPDQLYFHRDPTLKEKNVESSLKDYINGDIDDTRKKLLGDITDGSRSVKDLVDEVKSVLDAEGTVNLNDKETRETWLKHVLKTFAKSTGVIKAFRNYHVLTSSKHILSNSISSDAAGTFTVATISHSDHGLIFRGGAEADEETGKLKFSNATTTTLMVDGGLADEEKREAFLEFPNCIGTETAKQYAVATLWNSQKDGYTGTIEIIGNPKIKPFDICYIFDEANDMFGPVEVEQVIHRFNDNGFITEITPDMVCHVNQATTMASADAMGLVAEHAIRAIAPPAIGTMFHNGLSFDRITDSLINGDVVDKGLALGVSLPLAVANRGFNLMSTLFFSSQDSVGGSDGASSIFGLTGSFIWSKLMTSTQFAHPIIYSPLVVSGKPMLGGTPTRRIDNSFIQSVKGWFKGKAYDSKLLLDEVYDNIRPNNWLNQSQGNFWKTFNGGNR